MPFLLTALAINVIFALHAAMTGRSYRWVVAILGLPLVGAFAYVVAEMIPEYTETRLLYHTQQDR